MGFLATLQAAEKHKVRASGSRLSAPRPSSFLSDLRRSLHTGTHRSQGHGITKQPRTPTRPVPPMDTRMPVTMVAQVPLASVGAGRRVVNDERRHERERDVRIAAERRAEALASTTATPEQRARLTAGLTHMATIAQFGAAATTLKKDDCAWAQWRAFSDVYGFDPIVTREQAVQQPDLSSPLAWGSSFSGYTRASEVGAAATMHILDQC